MEFAITVLKALLTVGLTALVLVLTIISVTLFYNDLIDKGNS